MPAVTLRQIEAFKAVVEHGTVSQAAIMLSVSQPSLTRLIANLERETGLQLFARQKGRLVLSAQGRRLYAEVDRIFVGLDQIRRALYEIRREEAEVLRIGILPALADQVLERTVMEYRALRPNVRLSITVQRSAILADSIANGQFDILVASRSTEIKGLKRISLSKNPVVCIMPVGHPLSAETIVTPESFARYPIITLTNDSPLPHRVDEVLTEAGQKMNSMLEVSTVNAICQFVAQGMGVSLVHPLVAASVRAEIVARPFKPDILADFHIYQTASERVRHYANEFIDLLQANARQLVADLETGRR